MNSGNTIALPGMVTISNLSVTDHSSYDFMSFE